MAASELFSSSTAASTCLCGLDVRANARDFIGEDEDARFDFDERLPTVLETRESLVGPVGDRGEVERRDSGDFFDLYEMGPRMQCVREHERESV